jgi:hypothetical protein
MEENKQERERTQQKIGDEWLSSQSRVSETDDNELLKIDLIYKQNPNLTEEIDNEYKGLGSSTKPKLIPNGHQHDTRTNSPKDGGTSPWQILDVQLPWWFPVDTELIIMWDWWHWKTYLLSFPYICRTSNLESVCDLDIIFKVA